MAVITSASSPAPMPWAATSTTSAVVNVTLTCRFPPAATQVNHNGPVDKLSREVDMGREDRAPLHGAIGEKHIDALFIIRDGRDKHADCGR